MKKNYTLKNKILKGMKICSLQVVIAITLGILAFAHDNFAQVLDKKITVTLKEVSIDEALDVIGSAAGVKFFYSIDQLNVKDKLTLNAVNRSLRQILAELLSPYHVKYKVHEKKGEITLKRQEQDARSELVIPETDQRLTSVSSHPAAATITGTVTDAATGQPMAGVNIIVRGTTDGTTTDADGKFSIWATDKDVLVFSFIGYTTFETPVGGRSVIDVVLEQDVKNLKEVVVNAGYWQVKDREQTGNITKVTAEVIQKQPVENPLQALQARVPGLEITQQTGVPGGNFKVRIRGTNSIANGNDPLYIVDGVPFTSTSMAMSETTFNIFIDGTSPLNGINPGDIESIEVLKDADATAIYGSRGANGVILITTKKGKPGNTRVDFNLYTGVGRPASKMDLLKTREYIRMRKETDKNDNRETTPLVAPDVLVWDTTRYTDWQKKLIGNPAKSIDGQLSMSGGDKYVQFLIGVGYHKESTVFPGDNSDARISTHIGLTSMSKNEKLQASVSFKYSINDSNLLKYDLTNVALRLPPNAPPLFKDNGDLNWGTDLATDAWVFPNFVHPLSYLKMDYDAKTKNLLMNSVVSYEIGQGLQVKTNLGYSDIAMNAITTTPASSLAPNAPDPQNSSAFSTSYFRNWTIEPQVNWTHLIRRHKFDILLGATFLEQVEQGISQLGSGFSSAALMKNLAAASSYGTATNYYSQYRYSAGFGRINYAANGKYILNITFRRDGSSRFGQGKQFANFGAIGAAWLFSNENFFKNSLPFLSFGKLRGSYGITGNDQLANYQYLDSYTSSGSYPHGGIVGLRPVRLSNPEFAWETNKKIEVGFELGFMKDRIEASISCYRNRSSDQLVGLPLPPTTGFASIQANLDAVVENRGLEAILNTRNIEKANFKWTTTANVSLPRNKLVSFPNLKASPSYSNTLVVGEPMNILKRYHYTGVDPQTGLYTFEDVNGDGLINSLDQQTIKFLGQDLQGGFLNTLQYKNFQLDVQLQIVKQKTSNFVSSFIAQPGAMQNQPALVMERWMNEGDVADVQRFTYSPEGYTAYTLFRSSDASITDGSYLRLKNLSISYSLAEAISQRLKMDGARVFVQAQNLLTWTHYSGLDPETLSYYLPPMKVVSAGIHLTL